jgi:16S rRNA (cytosine1402-N4)-methyltransferase
MSDFHTPVLVDKVIEFLNIKEGDWYVDCNLGGGGHTREILSRGGRVLGIDWDQDAIDQVSQGFEKEIEKNLLIVKRENFTQIKELVDEVLKHQVEGVLFDLGVSSHQFDQRERGFSFQREAPLDMRMDQTLSVRAMDLVNGLNEGELVELFRKLGEEVFSKRIAHRIVEQRSQSKIETTEQLANLIKSVVPHSGKIHPATKVFQALRIAVNDELNNLKDALPSALDVLDEGGRMVVISFQSLEDRIVKNFFKEREELGEIKILTEKPLIPSEDEIYQNPRARSAKLRVAQKS